MWVEALHPQRAAGTRDASIVAGSVMDGPKLSTSAANVYRLLASREQVSRNSSAGWFS